MSDTRTTGETPGDGPGLDFIRAIVAEDLRTGKHRRVVTRFPPEPNGYLHIGHAKAICLSFGIAEEFDGQYHLRFDDTNPVKEEHEYIEAIQEDVRWLGFDWGEHLYFASDYFEQLYRWAEHLVEHDLAYVDDSTAEEIRALRGTLTEPGQPSPYRDRTAAESLGLLRRMRAGEFANGERVLRAKIDMTAGNINLRDPVLYRILHAEHPRTGRQWCIYPTYDFAHGQSDAIEHITHSLCSLEFEAHRPLYDWLVEHLPVPSRPRQIEFARLNLNYTVMSKRKLLGLVNEGVVAGWDDPRMPTLSGMRRRGFTPEAIRAFCDRVGVAKRDSVVDVALLEHCVRDDLNQRVRRSMAVLRPLKVVIENYPDDQVEELEAPYFPDDPPRMGARTVPFSRELYVERHDFREDPPKKFFRLAPGREVRLRWGFFIRCHDVVKDPETGEVVELRCTYDPETRGGSAPDGRKVRGTIHWVSAAHAVDAEVRLYDRLFRSPSPGRGGRDIHDDLNPESLEVLTGCKLEPALAAAASGDRYQFERTGYFVVDPDSRPGRPVFNRTVPLRDSWAKIERRQQR
jgi:glutaminyl-tRNA synthetase